MHNAQGSISLSTNNFTDTLFRFVLSCFLSVNYVCLYARCCFTTVYKTDYIEKNGRELCTEKNAGINAEKEHAKQNMHNRLKKTLKI